MNTTLRDELFEAGFNNSEINTILSLIASKMPEKRSQDIDYGCQDCGAWEPWNACLDSVKSILKGGTE